MVAALMGEKLHAIIPDSVNEFWEDEGYWWPHEEPEYTFLAHAVLKCGQARYGDEWRPAQPDLDWTPSRSFEEATPQDKAWAVHLLGIDVSDPSDLTYDQWQLALNAYGRYLRRFYRAFEERTQICRELHKAGVHGKMKFAAMPERGGDIRPLPPWDIRARDWDARFAYCRIERMHPHNGDPVGSHLIFVENESLQQFLTNCGKSDSDGRSCVRLATCSQAPVRAKRRGRKPVIKEPVKKKMKADVVAGKFSWEELNNMNRQALASEYGVKSPTTAVDALKECLSEIQH